MAEIFHNWFGSESANFQGQFTASNAFSTLTKAIILKAAQSHPSALPTPPAKSKLHNIFTNKTDERSPATTMEHADFFESYSILVKVI